MTSAPTRRSQPSAAELYLELLKTCLTCTGGFEERFVPVQPRARGLRGLGHRALRGMLSRRGIRLVREADVDARARVEGRDWPTQAETMVGRARLDNLQQCIAEVVRDGVSGDLIETGVWRGGATIFMRGALAAYGEEHRTVWVADSFQGRPHLDPQQYPQDAGDDHWMLPHLAVSLQQVEANFARYGLLDDKVAFLEGWLRHRPCRLVLVGPVHPHHRGHLDHCRRAADHRVEFHEEMAQQDLAAQYRRARVHVLPS